MNIHHSRSIHYITDTDRIYPRWIEIVFEIKQGVANREISLRPLGKGEFLGGRLTINSSPDRGLDFKWPEMGRALDFEAVEVIFEGIGIRVE